MRLIERVLIALDTWPCPLDGSRAHSDEYAMVSDADSKHRLLIIPALFDEGNKLRHFTAEVMRSLENSGIATVLPDFAGCNESAQLSGVQSLSNWRLQAQAAFQHFDGSHILSIRAGALIAPPDKAGFRYAPIAGMNILRGLLRAKTISEKEAGRSISRDELLLLGREQGLSLGGYGLSAEMIAELEDAALSETSMTDILQGEIGGGGLWLRSDPGHDPEQASNLAAKIIEQLA